MIDLTEYFRGENKKNLEKGFSEARKFPRPKNALILGKQQQKVRRKLTHQKIRKKSYENIVFEQIAPEYFRGT